MLHCELSATAGVALGAVNPTITAAATNRMRRIGPSPCRRGSSMSRRGQTVTKRIRPTRSADWRSWLHPDATGSGACRLTARWLRVNGRLSASRAQLGDELVGSDIGVHLAGRDPLGECRQCGTAVDVAEPVAKLLDGDRLDLGLGP